MKNNSLRVFAGVLIGAFGLLTLFMSSSVIFDLFGIREKEGNYVLFVVVANFICSILYLVSSVGIIKKRNWAFYILAVSVLILIITYIGLFLHINSGGIYEPKTIKAMAFRTVLTSIITIISYLTINKKNKINEN